MDVVTAFLYVYREKHMDLNALSDEELQALVRDAEAMLDKLRRVKESTLHREIAQAARAAGLTPEEWRVLTGD